jgi:hypothetical protein
MPKSKPLALLPPSYSPSSACAQSDAIGGKDLNLKTQALSVLCKVLHRPNAVIYALHHGFVGLLFSAGLSEASAECRALATAALQSVARMSLCLCLRPPPYHTPHFSLYVCGLS